jgi:hypothetical protein
MAANPSDKKKGSIILHMHPLQRILLSLVITLLVFLVIRNRQLDGCADDYYTLDRIFCFFSHYQLDRIF